MTQLVEIISLQEFEKVIEKGLRLVLFTASWSRPCQEQCRNVHKIEKDLVGLVPVALVDVEKCPSIAADVVIQTIPTCVIYRDREEILRLVGLQREEVLRSVVKEIRRKK
ncbi:thioredoxin family protein [Desulfomarina sp.]